eukprot:6193655-Amphidinium_carterae.2
MSSRTHLPIHTTVHPRSIRTCQLQPGKLILNCCHRGTIRNRAFETSTKFEKDKTEWRYVLMASRCGENTNRKCRKSTSHNSVHNVSVWLKPRAFVRKRTVCRHDMLQLEEQRGRPYHRLCNHCTHLYRNERYTHPSQALPYRGCTVGVPASSNPEHATQQVQQSVPSQQ